MRKIITIFLFLFYTQNVVFAGSSTEKRIFVPLISNSTAIPAPARWINVPYFSVGDLDSKISEMSILWFGKVTQDENYVDVRMGYNDVELFIRAQIFDRRLWYNTNPTTSAFENWDSLAVTINTDLNMMKLSTKSYRFIGELYWWEGSTNFKKGYQGSETGWIDKPLVFTEDTGWRGDAPNNNIDDRGWVITYHIPFSTLGLPGTPVEGTSFRIGFSLFDRDSNSNLSLAPKIWPENYDEQNPSSWGGLRFGLPNFPAPNARNLQTYTIRQGANGIQVPDASVGGGTVCGDGLDFWTQWGNKNYQGDTSFNVQNQADVADWPCFSKYYLTIPLTSIPTGKVIKAARLSLHQFGNSDPTQAYPSLIQAMTIKEDWTESTLTWNNAPYAYENIAQTWVNVLHSGVPWPGIEYLWNVSASTNQAYQNNQSLRLVLYSADNEYHSGKYLTTSESGDWNAVGRPTLFVDWGDPY